MQETVFMFATAEEEGRVLFTYFQTLLIYRHLSLYVVVRMAQRLVLP